MVKRITAWFFCYCYSLVIAVWAQAPGQTATSTNTSATLRFLEHGWSDYERLDSPQPGLAEPFLGPAKGDWTLARKKHGKATVELGKRVVLRVEPGIKIDSLIAGLSLVISKQVSAQLVILEAPDSPTAIEAAQILSTRPGVVSCYPVMRRPYRHHGGFSPAPNDPLYKSEWQLSNRGSDGNGVGPDLNVRAAWSVTKGEGVVVAVADTGVEIDHPDLAQAAASGPHYNYFESIADGSPYDATADHGTAVSGLIAAQANNGIGVAGVAPGAGLASWVVFGLSPFSGADAFATDEQLAELLQSSMDTVGVQNHSWGSGALQQSGIDALSDSAIEKAVTEGRGGNGVVMVRAGGNDRLDLINANDDGFASDPRVITVAAVRKDGRACSYSNQGACILVSAPSGDAIDTDGDGIADSEDPNSPDVETTDRVGDLGYSAGTNEAANYAGFNGTSASSPEVAGVVALILSARPDLTYRDVQQLLLLSSRHYDSLDPDRKLNGAGLYFSHNQGFGVPDAGVAVDRAKRWIKRPAAIRITKSSSVVSTIPDDSLRVVASASGISTSLTSIRSLPSKGPHPDGGTAALPLVSVGLANSTITANLQGKAALIQRGVNFFSNKIDRAFQAGASFAIIYNNTGTSEIQAMGSTDYVPIPAVSISKNDGEALVAWLSSHPATTVKIDHKPTVTSFNITNTLLCEHVGVRLKTTHTSRSDVRVTLVSPSGSRSVLQAINGDDTAGPSDWTYWSTKHFFETSAGIWRVEVSDERNTDLGDSSPATGSVTFVEILIDGVPILDTDHDGLADDWEKSFFGNLSHVANEDPDLDGFNNAQEQILGTNPTVSDSPFQVEMTPFDSNHWRLTWPSRPGVTYRVFEGKDMGVPFTQKRTVTGVSPFSEAILLKSAAPQFFYIQTN